MEDTGRAVTRDTLFTGELTCLQHKSGYRFSVDSILAAHFLTPPAPGGRVLDLGAGCGVIALILAYRHPGLTITALELQPSLFSLLERNCAANFPGRVIPVAGDLRDPGRSLDAGAYDAVVCNPPYYKRGSGRRNPDPEQASARHELTATLDDTVAAARFALRVKGRAVFVYPAARAAELLAALRRHRLEPARLQVVYSAPGRPGVTILVEAVRGGGVHLQIEPPFFIYHTPTGRRYSPEMQALYAPNP